MFVLHGVAIVKGIEKPIAIMVDTGCTTSCIPKRNAQYLGLPQNRRHHTKHVSLADGSVCCITHEAMITFRIAHYFCTIRVDISQGSLDPQDMLLGMDWLTKTNPRVGFNPLSLKVISSKGLKHELVSAKPPARQRYCSKHGYRCPHKIQRAYMRRIADPCDNMCEPGHRLGYERKHEHRCDDSKIPINGTDGAITGSYVPGSAKAIGKPCPPVGHSVSSNGCNVNLLKILRQPTVQNGVDIQNWIAKLDYYPLSNS